MTHFFALDKQLRDARCSAKDEIVRGVISRLDISTPKKFTAVMMPAAHGPEVDLLESKGVRLNNIFAIERDATIRKMQVERGMLVPYKALPSHFAVDHIPFERVDFCYLDFLGRPSTSHLETVRKIMRLNLLRPGSANAQGSCLLVTLGVNRGDIMSTPIRSREGQVFGDVYLRAAVKWARGLQPKKVTSHEYTSVAHRCHVARYITTEMWF